MALLCALLPPLSAPLPPSRATLSLSLTLSTIHALTTRFVALWNNGSVKDSISSGAVAATGSSDQTTSFRWGFAKDLSSADLLRLDKAKHSVKVSTDDVMVKNETTRGPAAAAATKLKASYFQQFEK